jgi:hypothetical protein
MATFKNPANGYTEEASGPFSWLWCLLFGVFYFAVKGNWKHVFIGLILAVITGGISWLIYPFFVYGINDYYYQLRGWIKIN